MGCEQVTYGCRVAARQQARDRQRSTIRGHASERSTLTVHARYTHHVSVTATSGLTLRHVQFTRSSCGLAFYRTPQEIGNMLHTYETDAVSRISPGNYFTVRASNRLRVPPYLRRICYCGRYQGLATTRRSSSFSTLRSSSPIHSFTWPLRDRRSSCRGRTRSSTSAGTHHRGWRAGRPARGCRNP